MQTGTIKDHCSTKLTLNFGSIDTIPDEQNIHVRSPGPDIHLIIRAKI